MQRKIWKVLTSVRLAVWLIGIIALLCTIATTIPQNQTEVFYTDHYGNIFGTIILALAFDKMYSSALFILVGLAFGVNLCCCTWLRFRWAAAVSKPNFQLYAWGSPILHVGLCVVLLGAGMSAVLGRESYYEGMIGDVIEVYEGTEGFTMQVDDVTVEYYPDTDIPKQYRTDMTLTARDGTVIQDYTQVNRRGKFKGAAVLQSQYGWASRIRVGEGDAAREVALKDERWEILSEDASGTWQIAGDFMPDYAEDPEMGPYSKSEQLNNPRLVFMVALNDQVLDLAVLREGQSATLAEEIPVTFLSYENYTGMHVKYDPGVPFIFTGFVVTCIGLVIRFMPNREEKKDDIR